MFKRFIKAVKDAAKKVWEFIKRLLPKKPKPEPEPVEEEEDPYDDFPPDDEPEEPEEVTPEEVIPVEEEEDPFALEGVSMASVTNGFIRVYDRGGRRVVSEYFHSVDELLNCLSARKNNRIMAGHHSSNKESSDFSGTSSFREAVTLMRKGYSDILDEVKNNTYEQVKNLVHSYEAKKSTPTIGVFGAAPNIQRHLMGLPEAMISRQVDPKKLKTVHILYSPQAPWFVSRGDFIKAGISLLAAIELIEKSGISVRLDCTFYSGGGGDEAIFGVVNLKDYKHRLDTLKLCFPLAHPSMLRRIGFKFLETVPQMTDSSFTLGYGRSLPTAEERLLYKTDPGTVILGLDTIRDKCHYDVEEVIKYIKDHVNK